MSKWDVLIERSFNGLIYAYSWYLDITCDNDWDALVEGDYESVMPLPKGKKKFGFLYIYRPLFTQQLGVFSASEITDEKVKRFLSHIPRSYLYLEMSLNTSNHFEDDSFEISNGVTHLLNLNQSYDSLYKNYNQDRKKNLKKAFKKTLTITKEALPLDVINLFKTNR